MLELVNIKKGGDVSMGKRSGTTLLLNLIYSRKGGRGK